MSPTRKSYPFRLCVRACQRARLSEEMDERLTMQRVRLSESNRGSVVRVAMPIATRAREGEAQHILVPRCQFPRSAPTGGHGH